MAGGSIGRLIRNRRLELGLTQREIATRIGVTEASVSRWESGETGNMRRDRIAKLAEVLKMSPLKLIEGENSETSQGADSVEYTPNKFGLQALRRVMRSVGQDVRLVPRIGVIACGTPILADENLDGYEYIDRRIKADFALVAKGESMIEAGIRDGFVVFIRQTEDVDNGEIAAVLVDGEATLKRVYKTRNSVVLVPANKNYHPIVITASDGQDVRILGKAVALKGEL